jgi:uncharacterized membrane protein
MSSRDLISLRYLGERADLSVPRGSAGMGARYDADAFGRFSEAIARFLGTGRFLFWQTLVVIGWIVLNSVGFIQHWDPYPFILLNLAFSTQAAYAAPLILLAQNRQDDRDRANIERDREVAAPGSQPAGSAALWVSEWIWPISLAMVAFLFLLFPTGRLRSRR